MSKFDSSYDIVVVGAGWYGLAAAKAASQMMPTSTMAILESAESCGGTWSANRLYPGLKSNNMRGTYEYPDFPMTDAYGVAKDQHIPGTVLHTYLTDFAKAFDLFDKVQFHTKVNVVEPTDDEAWSISISAPKGTKTYRAAKIILATGLTSTPNMPEYKGADTFDAPLFHAKDFCARADELKGAQNTVVVGGAKSAYDVAYAMAMDGSTVHLVVRDNGHGPVWITPPKVTPFKKRLDQLLLIRWMTWFAPCPWGGEDGFPRIRRLLHGTRIGRWITDFFWKTLGDDVTTAVGYDEHPEMKKLKPWNSAFWIGSGLSIHNYNTSLWDLVRSGQVKVHVGQIDHIEPKTVVLADGTRLAADAMVCSTGWKKESTIQFQGLKDNSFGLDCTPGQLRALNDKADKDVLTQFPRLADQPTLKFTPKAGEPLRYYRFMVPSGHVFKRNIAFSGAVSTVSTSTCATIQGHWIAAYLANQLDRAPTTQAEITEEIMLHTQWGKWRFPCGYGANLPDFVFEGLPYVDMLLRDLGLNSHRKGSWWRELTSPYLPRDFRGLVEEWKHMHDEPLKKK
ncbi:Flavin monooxygenase-like protein [Emericellopsis cladophorae]|uniref:Flavin monooxygenase-like protein n=1 Tax=Emericellopsis cladophorae TaxID=2686198 RepID=A0A9Q0BDU0_9HYPO|nr:Flavin monooxygenase-like protein [Emericellopsis cladophorae]KAI6781161.1 Flavin monooxygenase-like protein [Emericellopsis cladophorae]